MRRQGRSLVVTPAEARTEPDAPVAVLAHLSGSRRGHIQRLRKGSLQLGASPDADICVSPEPMVARVHATLWRQGRSYLLKVEPECLLWVNGEPVRERELVSGDLIEVGRDGPVLRFRLYPPRTRLSKSLREAFADGIDGARAGSSSLAGRAFRGMAGTAREIAMQTTLWFRLAMLVVILALAATSVALFVRSGRLAERLEREELRVTGLAKLLRENNRRLDAGRIDELRWELAEASDRLAALEERSDAVATVVAQTSRAVILVQGAYGFVLAQTGEPLRFAGIGPDGLPMRSPNGDPLVSVEGEGPPVEAQFLGTAFVAGEGGLLVTNRHVALPWHYDPDAQMVMRQGLEPRMHRLIGYLPGTESAFEATLLASADDADLALLQAPDVIDVAPVLELSRQAPRAGAEVVVLGYPAGIRALLARSDERLVEQLMSDPSMSFWDLARRLAEAGQIGPLASRGIVAQVSPSAVVYDAETTRGGSGGPVLDLDGRVVAVTSAVVTEFGGSNIGVPADRVVRLIDEAVMAVVESASTD